MDEKIISQNGEKAPQGPAEAFETLPPDKASEAISAEKAPETSEAPGDPVGGEEDQEKDTEEISAQEVEPPSEDEIASLREQIKTLREELGALEEIRKNSERLLSEIKEFGDIFPNESIENIPEEVWNTVRKGSSLAASYALYEKKLSLKAAMASTVNRRNAALSPGQAGTDAACEYFTPEQVRAMSRSEVHKNFSKIRESMKKWN